MSKQFNNKHVVSEVQQDLRSQLTESGYALAAYQSDNDHHYVANCNLAGDDSYALVTEFQFQPTTGNYTKKVITSIVAHHIDHNAISHLAADSVCSIIKMRKAQKEGLEQ